MQRDKSHVALRLLQEVVAHTPDHYQSEFIELGRLEEAEQKFRASLAIDPNSKVAKHELQYIAQLRAGGTAGHVEAIVTRGGAGMKCQVCKRPLEEGTVHNVDGDIIYICPRCAGKASKKWWQFWN